MEENPQKNSTWKRLLILIAGLLIVAAIAVGVIALLRLLFAPTPPKTETPSISVGEVVSGVKTAGNIKAFENYQEQVTDTPSGQVTVTLEGKNYAVNLPTKYSVLFFAKTPGQQSDIAEVEQQVSSFMTEKGYNKTENTGQIKKSENPLYITYKSNVGVCQLASAQPTTQDGLAYHTISCSESAAISQEYTAIDTLLTLYKKQQELPVFTQANRTTITEENKTLALLSLKGEGSAQLLFAAIDNNWEYIGNIGSGADANGKYAISDDVRSKIDDVRWGNFLKKNLKQPSPSS